MQILKPVKALLVPSERTRPTKKNPEQIAIASEDARQFILQLSIASTLLCKELNNCINQSPEFEAWARNGKIPDEVLKNFWNTVRGASPYEEMPERFSRSAWIRVRNIYTAWFRSKENRLRKLNGLNRWLDMVESDQRLAEISGCELETIRARAEQILSEAKLRLQAAKQPVSANIENREIERCTEPAQNQVTSTDTPTVPEQDKNREKGRDLVGELFETYFSLVKTDGALLDRCAIVHLLKNGCKTATGVEDVKKFEASCRKKRKKAERLEKQLSARLPQLRDLGNEALKALEEGVQVVSLKDTEFAAQLARLQRKPNPLPYPVLFYSGNDLEWHLIRRKHPDTQQIEERIFVKFKGLNTYLKNQLKKLKAGKNDLKKEYVFEVCCGYRQLQTFQTFQKDWQMYISDRNRYPVTLFAFQSAELFWKESMVNGVPQLQLYLHCTVEHRQLTAERAEPARLEEVEKVSKKIANYEAKQESGKELTENQQKDLKRARGQLAALDNPYPRPAKPLYRGNPTLVVGVSFSIELLATVTVLDCSTRKVIAYRSMRQLLGGDYASVSAYRLKQGRNANERHKQQLQGRVSTLSESNQGKHIDRLIAKAIVKVVEEFKAGSLALPDLKGYRESLQSELEARAEWKYPGDREKQEAYEKQYKINLQKWSYRRLTACIEERAGKVGVPLERGQQPEQGDCKEKAVQIAWSAYRVRQDAGLN